jgi:hypothetical protein
MGNDLLHNGIIGTNRDLRTNFFSKPPRSTFIGKFKKFHSDDAVTSRAAIVAQRRKEEERSGLFKRVHLIHGWNDYAKCSADPETRGIRLGSADGGSQTIPELIIQEGYLGAIHRTAMDVSKQRSHLPPKTISIISAHAF